MPEFEKEEFKFPDEKEQTEVKVEADEGFEIEIEDDTPPEDRGKKPSDPEFVAAAENDELEEY